MERVKMFGLMKGSLWLVGDDNYVAHDGDN